MLTTKLRRSAVFTVLLLASAGAPLSCGSDDETPPADPAGRSGAGAAGGRGGAGGMGGSAAGNAGMTGSGGRFGGGRSGVGGSGTGAGGGPGMCVPNFRWSIGYGTPRSATENGPCGANNGQGCVAANGGDG